MAMPQGLLALGAVLQDGGHQVEVLHLGLELALDPSFELEQEVRRRRPELVGISLHWHHGSLDALEAAMACRRGGAAFVVLGGITASLFAREILERWRDEVDAVIRGDGEAPLLALVEALEPGPARLQDRLATVPNLSWRRGGEVEENPLTYSASTGDLNRLCYTRFSLLRNASYYSGQMTFDPRVGSLSAHALLRRFNLPISRGCARDCPRCGGARTALGPATGRAGATFASEEAVLRTMAEAVTMGVEAFYVSCHPPDDDPGYFLRLFRLVRRAGLRCALEFEAFPSLPDEAFLDAFAATFIPSRSRIIISPQGGEARRRRLGIRYTDADLDRLLGMADHRGISVRSHVGLGPGDSREDQRLAIELAASLRGGGTCTRDLVPLLDEVDPRAPWTRDAHRAGLSRPTVSLEHLLGDSRLRRERPQAMVVTGYDPAVLLPAWLALRAAALPPRRILTALRAGAPHPSGHRLAWAPRQFLRPGGQLRPEDLPPRAREGTWVVLVGGEISPHKLLDAAGLVLDLFPGVVDLRLGPEDPPCPEARSGQVYLQPR